MLTRDDKHMIQGNADSIYNYIFHLLDSEPDLDGDEASRIAGIASSAVARELAKTYEFDTPKTCREYFEEWSELPLDEAFKAIPALVEIEES